MSVILSIVPTTRRRPGRFLVDVSGGGTVTLSLDTIDRLGLSVGLDVTEIGAELAREEALTSLYDRALDLLAFRARSGAELGRALVRKGGDRVLVAAAVDRLQAQGLVDDAAFARSFARAKIVGANHSRRRVQQDLSRKGVSRDVSDAAIDGVFEDEGVDRSALVVAAARKKLRSLASLDVEVRRRRLYGFLARRGFDGDDIRAAMNAVGVGLNRGADG